MKKFIPYILLIVTLFVLTGCNTIRGIGQDFEDAGESMQEAAD